MYQSSGCFYICDSNLGVIKKIFSVHMCGFLHTGFLSGMEGAMVIFCLEEEVIDEEFSVLYMGCTPENLPFPYFQCDMLFVLNKDLFGV